MFANKTRKPANRNHNSWGRKEERIKIAKQIVSTIEKITEEVYYIDTADLQDMPKEERILLAKKIASSVSCDWVYPGCERME